MARKHRLSASVDAELVAAGQDAVAAGMAANLSTWVNEALRRQADHDRRLAALGDFLAEFEKEASDPRDLALLAAATGVHADVVNV